MIRKRHAEFRDQKLFHETRGNLQPPPAGNFEFLFIRRINIEKPTLVDKIHGNFYAAFADRK